MFTTNQFNFKSAFVQVENAIQAQVALAEQFSQKTEAASEVFESVYSTYTDKISEASSIQDLSKANMEFASDLGLNGAKIALAFFDLGLSEVKKTSDQASEEGRKVAENAVAQVKDIVSKTEAGFNKAAQEVQKVVDQVTPKS